MWIPTQWSFFPTWMRSFCSSTYSFSKQRTTSLSTRLCISKCSYPTTFITGMLSAVPSATPRFSFAPTLTLTMVTTYFSISIPRILAGIFHIAFPGWYNFKIALVRTHGAKSSTLQWSFSYKTSYTAWHRSFWSRESWFHRVTWRDMPEAAGQASSRPQRIFWQISSSISAW